MGTIDMSCLSDKGLTHLHVELSEDHENNPKKAPQLHSSIYIKIHKIQGLKRRETFMAL